MYVWKFVLHIHIAIYVGYLQLRYYQQYIIEKRVLPYTLSKMSPLSNSVYSSVFMYRPNVLTRPYQHLTTKALIEPHHITCISLDISVFIVRLWRPSTRMKSRCPHEPSEMNLPPFNKSFFGYLTNCLITMHQTMDYPYQ